MSIAASSSARAVDRYPSRTGGELEWIARRDPVVHPGDFGAGDPATSRLSSAEAESFERDGFLFFPQLLSAEETRNLQEEVVRLTRSVEVRELPEAVLEPDSDTVRSIFRVHRLSETLDRLSKDRRILDAARRILGGEVYIHQSRVNLKSGFDGREFYWHSDFETWHVEDGMPRMRALSASVLLTDNNPYNGPLMLIPGSHRVFVTCGGETPENNYQQSLRRQLVGVPDRDSLSRLVSEGGIASPTGPAGSVLLFDCNTMHGSGSNISPFPRNNIFMVYNSVENRLTEPFCGRSPRPEHVASRRETPPLRPAG